MIKTIAIRKPTLWAVIFGYIVSKSINLLYKKDYSVSPQIESYSLVEEINKGTVYQEYSLGKYTDGKNFYFIKTWKGQFRDYSYYSLINEYFITKVLSQSLSKRRTKNRLYVPAVKDILISRNTVSVVFEFIDGLPLSSFSQNLQQKYLSFTLKELKLLSLRLKEKERHLLIPHYKIFYAFMVPIYAMIAIVRHVTMIRSILAALIKTYALLMQTDGRKLFIAHRDITLDNLLVKDEKVYLLDCERMVLTLPLYDYENISIDLGIPTFKARARMPIDSFFRYFIPLQMIAIETEIGALDSYVRRLEAIC